MVDDHQYVGGAANTVPFDRAPGAVIKACDLIQSRILAALSITATFNEVLRYVIIEYGFEHIETPFTHSAAYMEGQKMAVEFCPFCCVLRILSPF